MKMINEAIDSVELSSLHTCICPWLTKINNSTLQKELITCDKLQSMASVSVAYLDWIYSKESNYECRNNN